MGKFSFVCALVVLPWLGHSQNLVPNPSFECGVDIFCGPYQLLEIQEFSKHACGWTVPGTGTTVAGGVGVTLGSGPIIIVASVGSFGYQIYSMAGGNEQIDRLWNDHIVPTWKNEIEPVNKALIKKIHRFKF